MPQHRLVFDAADDQRHDARTLAKHICRTQCPALAACQRWLAAMLIDNRPHGAVVGWEVVVDGHAQRQRLRYWA